MSDGPRLTFLIYRNIDSLKTLAGYLNPQGVLVNSNHAFFGLTIPLMILYTEEIRKIAPSMATIDEPAGKL